MRIGTSATERQAQESSTIMKDLWELKEGPNLFRFLQGPIRTKVIFIPVIKETDGQFESDWTTIRFAESGGITDGLLDLEQSVRRKLGESNPDYGFKPNTQWVYLAYRLTENPEGKIKPVKVPKGVKDDILKLETDLDIKDPEFLRNGLFWMYDILIEKRIDRAKGVRYGTSYEVSIYGNNPFMGVVPATYLRESPDAIIESIGAQNIFQKEIIDAMQNFEIDLSEELKPMTETQIATALSKLTINLSAVNKNSGKYKYPQVTEFKEGLESFGIKFMEIQEDQLSKSNTPEQKPIKGGLQFKKPEPVPENKPVIEDKPVVEKEAVASTVNAAPGLKKLKGLGKPQ